MTNEEINRAIHAAISKEPWLGEDYCSTMDRLMEAEVAVGLRDRERLVLRVGWINAVRDEVAPDCPKNKVGAYLVSDVDVMLASTRKRAIGLVKALAKISGR